ncbi:MAG: hypothetical protein RL277_326 [Planctomycetota bacterium]|jgi:flagellar biosynthesis protein FlhG
MNWDQARKWFSLRRPQQEGPQRAFRPRGDALHIVRASSLCIASGKGGTGKSIVSSALATLLARSGRTLLVDADMGVGNAHILQNQLPEHSLVEVAEGRRCARDVLVACRPQLDLLAAGSGVSHMAELTPLEMQLIASGIEELEGEYRHLVVDSAAGISPQTVSFAAASDVVLILTTPDITALTDAYAFFKVLLQRRGDCTPLLLVNRAADAAEAQATAERFRSVARRFLQRDPRLIGWLPDDRAAVQSIARREPVVVACPESELSKALVRLSVALEQELARTHPRGLGRTLLRTVPAPASKRAPA